MTEKDGNQESIDNWETESLDTSRCEVLILAGAKFGRNKYQRAAKCLDVIDSTKDRLGGIVSEIKISDPRQVLEARLDGIDDACSIGKGSIHVRVNTFYQADFDRIADEYPSDVLVLVYNISPLGSDAAELRDALDALAGEERSVYVASANLNVNASNKEIALKLLAELDDVGTDLKREAARKEFLNSITDEERRHDGRPPAFFDVEDGKIVPSDEYDKAVETLRAVKVEDKSKAAAARHLDCSRRTISRCLERPFLYCLD